jgi:YggT family protein
MISSIDLVLAALRPAFAVAALVVAVICAVDWAVRTRRISPFNGVSRFFRKAVDPMMAPVERAVVRAGGLPASAPMWTLAAVVVGGILILSVLGFIRGEIAVATVMAGRGPGGIVQLLISWIFQILQIALIVRVVCSWIRVSPYSKWVRWAFVLTEPILAPLRRVIPPLGMIDISPIVAYFLLSVLEWALMSLL